MARRAHLVACSRLPLLLGPHGHERRRRRGRSRPRSKRRGSSRPVHCSTTPERAALHLAAAAGASPNKTTDEHFAQLRHFFSDTAIAEIVAVIALFGFLNRWNDTMATSLEETALGFATQHLTAAGWDPGRDV